MSLPFAQKLSKLTNSSLSICPLREKKFFSQRALLFMRISQTTSFLRFPIQWFCKGGRGLTMSNSLAAMRPELVREWSDKNLPLTPDKITYGSNKIVWWKGKCGHEWQTSIKARSNASLACNTMKIISSRYFLSNTRISILSFPQIPIDRTILTKY